MSTDGGSCDETHRSTGAAIRRARQERRLCQAELAQLCGLTRRTILRIEAGRPGAPESLRRIALELAPLWACCAGGTVGGEDARVGRLLRDRRRSLGISLKVVALVIGVREGTLSVLERGKASPRGGWDSYLGDDLAKCLGFQLEAGLRDYLAL